MPLPTAVVPAVPNVWDFRGMQDHVKIRIPTGAGDLHPGQYVNIGGVQGSPRVAIYETQMGTLYMDKTMALGDASLAAAQGAIAAGAEVFMDQATGIVTAAAGANPKSGMALPSLDRDYNAADGAAVDNQATIRLAFMDDWVPDVAASPPTTVNPTI